MTLDLHDLNNNRKNGLFCLVDGAQIDHRNIQNIEYFYGNCFYLFKETYEEDAYKYGPILFDLSTLSKSNIDNLNDLMNKKDSMIFIKSSLEIKKLKNKLLENLYLQFDDGGIGVLRFYDPRVLKRFSQITTKEQKEQFMVGIEAMYFMLNKVCYEVLNND